MNWKKLTEDILKDLRKDVSYLALRKEKEYYNSFGKGTSDYDIFYFVPNSPYKDTGTEWQIICEDSLCTLKCILKQYSHICEIHQPERLSEKTPIG